MWEVIGTDLGGGDVPRPHPMRRCGLKRSKESLVEGGVVRGPHGRCGESPSWKGCGESPSGRGCGERISWKGVW